jgi:HYR domain-containing protein
MKNLMVTDCRLRGISAARWEWTPGIRWLVCAVVLLTRPPSTLAGTCTVNCSGDIIANAEPGKCAAVVTYPAPTTSGVCGTITCQRPSGSEFPVGVTTVSCFSSLNGGLCTFTVTVNDAEPPTPTCPQNVSLSANVGANCQAPVPDLRSLATDNCSNLTRSQNPAPGTMVDPGPHPITVTVTDPGGNTAQCTLDFTVTGPDADDDGAIDCVDGCPDDAGKTSPGDCGCGVADSDANTNGIPDCIDPPPGACGSFAQGVLPALMLSLMLMSLGRRRRFAGRDR